MLQRICDDEDAEHTGLSTKEMGMENSAPLIIFGGRARAEDCMGSGYRWHVHQRVSASDPRVPVGGVKNSGYRRELSYFGARAFVNAQMEQIES